MNSHGRHHKNCYRYIGQNGNRYSTRRLLGSRIVIRRSFNLPRRVAGSIGFFTTLRLLNGSMNGRKKVSRSNRGW